MSRVLAVRFVRLIVTVVLVSSVMFTLLFLTGDPVTMILAEGTPEDIARMREHMGLDDPFIIQFGRWVSSAVRGDFGHSFYYKTSVWPLISERLPATLTLTFGALGLSLLVAIPAGILSAVKRYSLADQVVTIVVLFGQSMPVFWTGIMLMLLFSVTLRWLPASGWGTWQQAVLPIISLAAFQTPMFLRIARSSMLEVLSLDYMRTARAKGLSERVVIYKHALKNASIPIVTVTGVQLALLMAGALITETVYAIPGLGRLLVRSMIQVDYTVVMAITFLKCLIVVACNLGVDVLYIYLDPRVKFQ